MALATIQYPLKFELAAKFMATHPSISSSMSIEDQLMFYGLHQQATEGPCNIPSPHLWNRVERAKWDVWKQLGNTSKIESMFLYTRSVEEHVPQWAQWEGLATDVAAALSSSVNPNCAPCAPKASNSSNTTIMTSASNSLATYPASPTSSAATKQQPEFPTKADAEEVAYGTWVGAVTKGQAPSPRYQHSCNMLGRRMVVFGGHGTCFLSDVHVLDIESRTWHQPEIVGITPEARAGHTGTSVYSKDDRDSGSGGRMIIFGGHTAGGSLNAILSLALKLLVYLEV